MFTLLYQVALKSQNFSLTAWMVRLRAALIREFFPTFSRFAHVVSRHGGVLSQVVNFNIPGKIANCSAGYYAFLFWWLKTDTRWMFDRQKKTPHRHSMCLIVLFLLFLLFLMGESAGKSEQSHSDLNSTVRGVLHAVFSDQTECGASWGTD